MYVNIPVKPETRDLLDMYREIYKAKSYDETLRELAQANSFLLLKDLKGILKNAPKFKRDHLERDFG